MADTMVHSMPNTGLLPPIEELPEPQQQIVALYEEAFSLPDSTVANHDNKAAEIEAANELADELLHDLVLSDMLRRTAFERVRKVKERQEELGYGSDVVADQREVEPMPSSAPGKQPRLPTLKEEVVRRALARAGLELDTEGGKGNHIKVFNPATGKTTTLNSLKGEVNPIPLKNLLSQLGVSRTDFLNSL